ncbi:uncharacterized protein LOC106070012 [Biomphalaria glabrata]|uniref:Uncharacterized protein LOC106070012 n=1 Tax=Biomphalaria glabrata TaxID=6526 RepID=A0A9U8EF79_BIOGL|nr:uncharacterized protein LOC106070012 [Biomphalaria glabrata]
MEEFPPAFVIASREAVSRNNNVLYRLVRTLPDGSGVESVDRLVNVVPHRRSYCMERKNEIDDFRHEILQRPLVLQPVLHFGRGFGHYCGLCYSDEPWVILINQTHPKILSRLQMGLDMAKAAIERGQAVEVRFEFGAIIQKVYREYLRQKEEEEAKESVSGIQDCLVSLRYAEWEHCNLVVRSHGYAARLNRSSLLYSLPNLDLSFKFEDIAMHEMIWSQLDGQKFTKPHLSRVTEDELRAQLPAWTINTISPLSDIGEDVPSHNYSYAQAGRLYESFRKKKPTRNQQPHHAEKPNYSSYHEEELQGAVGYDTDYDYTYPEDIDLNIESEARYEREDRHNEANHIPERYPGKYHSHNDSGVEDDWDRNIDSHRQVSDNNRHVDANVVVKPPRANGARPKVPASTKYQTSTSLYDKPEAADYHYYAPLKKQDSDRSSRSTNADSGYSPETEGHTSRESSYDYNDTTHVPVSKRSQYVNDGLPLINQRDPKIGLVNPSFQDYDSIALQKHKELVNSMLQDQKGKQRVNGLSQDNHSQIPKSAVTLTSKELLPSHFSQKVNSPSVAGKVAESYI